VKHLAMRILTWKCRIRHQSPTGDDICGHRTCLSVTCAHRATKQLKLRPYCFSCNKVMRPPELDAAIGFFVLCLKGFVCNSQVCAINGANCVSAI
jgi:hypothetical protein